MKSCVLGMLLALIFSVPSYAEEAKTAGVPDEKQETKEFKEPPLHLFDIITNVPGDYAAFAKNVFQLENFPTYLWLTSATIAGVETDHGTWQSTKYVFDNSDATGKKLWRAAANLGKGDRQIAVGALFALYGWIAGEKKYLRVASQIVEVVLDTGITTQILKHIIGRQSPDSLTNVPTGKWQLFTSPKNYTKHVSAHDAMPSGHVATAFASARILELSFPDNHWLPYVAYSYCAMAGVAMVATSGHWYSDYPYAMAIGYNFAKAVSRNNSEVLREQQQKKGEFSVFAPAPGVFAVTYSKRF